jgi:hypothetical protein
VKKAKVDAVIRRKATDAYRAGFVAGQCDEREKQTILLTPLEGAVVLGATPLCSYMRVPLPRPRVPRFAEFDPAYVRERVATFRAVQKCWTTGEGHKVAWFEWQFEGVSG